MEKKTRIPIALLTVLIAVMDITGIPSSFFIHIQVADIEPFYFTLMVNFLLIGVIAYFYLKKLCPQWQLGFQKAGFVSGLKQYGPASLVIILVSFAGFYFGLVPFDRQPSLAKVLVEGVVYYIGVAIVEELYVRGLLLNWIETLYGKRPGSTLKAVILSSVIFGLGHIFGVLGQPFAVIVSKVVWTIGMGIFFGMVYKMTNNLWLPIGIHFLINVSALPYCFSSVSGYADLTLYILVPAYGLLGVYSILELKKGKIPAPPEA